jgi:WD40 repeat protein
MRKLIKQFVFFVLIFVILACGVPAAQPTHIVPTATTLPEQTVTPATNPLAINVQNSCLLKFQNAVDPEYLNDVAWSPQGDVIAIALNDDILFYESSSLRLIGNIGVGGTEIAFSPNGFILAIGNDTEITFWDIKEKKSINKIKVGMARIKHIIYNSTGNSLAVLGDTRITGGDPNSALELWGIQPLRKIYENRETWDANIAFSPNGEKLALISNADLVLIQSSSGEELKADLTWEGGSIAFIDEETLIKRLDYDRLRIINIKTLETSKIINVQGSYSEFVISPDKRKVVFPNIWDTTQIWDLEAGKLLYELGYHSDVPRVDFSPDNKYFISADYEGCVRIHDLETGKMINLTK